MTLHVISQEIHAPQIEAALRNGLMEKTLGQIGG
jgi:hypothetical protein